MRVHVTRKGGLAGLTLAAAVEASDEAERALEQLVAAPASSGPPHPDGFEYRFDLPDGRSVTAPEQALPRELDALLDEFATNAKPGA